MKKKRTIVIKNPNLRKVRDNLRKLLLEWGSKQLDDLFNTRDSIERTKQGKMRRFNDLSSNEKARIEHITSKITKIRKIKNDSICQCAVCSASDKDMTYNPVRERWFCVECYYQLQQDFKGKEESILFP